MAGSRERRGERIRRLLAGELIDTSWLAYDFEVNHLGLIAKGKGSVQALRDFAASLDCRSLIIAQDGEEAWGWLGSRRNIEVQELKQAIAAKLPPAVSLALGEPARGFDGWRLTHQQARATLPIVLRNSEPTARYGDVALVASIFRDRLLATSLRRLYLDPLARERDGGQTLRQTLRTYFSTERNISSAAAALGVSRQAVAKRLCQAEERLERTLAERGVELELALRLETLDKCH